MNNQRIISEFYRIFVLAVYSYSLPKSASTVQLRWIGRAASSALEWQNLE